MATVTSTVMETMRAGRERRTAEVIAAEAAASAQVAAAALAAAQSVLQSIVPAAANDAPASADASGEHKSAAGASDAAFRYKAIGFNDDQGVIIGIGAAADNVDLDNEIVNKGALIKMAYDFCAATNRTFKANHTEVISCELVASWPGDPILKSGKSLKKGETISDDDEIVGIGIMKDSGSHWFVAVKPNDKSIVETAKKGGIAGFSWSGFCKKTPVDAKKE